MSGHRPEQGKYKASSSENEDKSTIKRTYEPTQESSQLPKLEQFEQKHKNDNIGFNPPNQ